MPPIKTITIRQVRCFVTGLEIGLPVCRACPRYKGTVSGANSTAPERVWCEAEERSQEEAEDAA